MDLLVGPKILFTIYIFKKRKFKVVFKMYTKISIKVAFLWLEYFRVEGRPPRPPRPSSDMYYLGCQEIIFEVVTEI